MQGADLFKAVAEKLGTVSILDYGSNRTARPEPADLVYYESVTVDPIFFETVLSDLVRLTRRAVFVVVPDESWAKKLEARFRLSRSFGLDGKFVFIGQSLRDTLDFPDLGDVGPPVTLKRVVLKSAYTDEQRCTNILKALLRRKPTIRILPPHDKTMVLACYGPSLKTTLGQLSNDIANGGDLYTVSGAHGFLIGRGIIPMAHIEADPRPHKAKCLGVADPRVVYFLSSACDPAMFDMVSGKETWIFHVTSSNAETQLIAAHDPGTFTLDGGTNVGMTAIAFGTALGYRRFSIHGMDCSFEVDDEFLHWPKDKEIPPNIRGRVGFHAAAHPNEDQDIYRVWVGARPFVSSPQMFQAAQDYLQVSARLKGCRFKLHGDGFLPNLVEFLSVDANLKLVTKREAA